MKRIKRLVAAMMAKKPKLPRPTDNESIKSLKLSAKIRKVLNERRVFTIGQLVSRTPSEAIKWRNFGYRMLLELQTALAWHGLELSHDVEI